MNYGFIPSKIESDHYVLGGFNSLPKTILEPTGQWDKYLPVYEAQATTFETAGCTVFGTLNALETLENRLTGLPANYSERYIYNIVPVRPPGADPHKVIETIREVGLIEQKHLPFTETFKEFCEPTPMTQTLALLGMRFFEKYTIGHEWVFTNAPDKKSRVALMKEALMYSPLGVSVSAWHEEDGVYVDKGRPNNHWCMCYGYTEANGQVFWKIFDSYDHSHKLLHPDHVIFYAKRYSLTPVQKKETWLISLLKSVVALIKPRKNVPDIIPAPSALSPRERLYNAAVSCLGTDASPKDVAPDEYGCMETVNEIYYKAFGEYIETPGISTTRGFAALVERADKFVRVTDVEPGNIIVSPTGLSNIPNTPIKNGHVGIFGKDGKIMSNSSTTGKFEENYTLDTWIARYRKQGGYPVYFFKRV